MNARLMLLLACAALGCLDPAYDPECQSLPVPGAKTRVELYACEHGALLCYWGDANGYGYRRLGCVEAPK